MRRKTDDRSKPDKTSPLKASPAGGADGDASASSTSASASAASFTDEERAAMKARAEELKAESKRGGRNKRAAGERALQDQIAGMPEPDRGLATRIHEIVMETAPGLEPKTWYGMPAYAQGGKVVCFFQSADKFKARYATFGFNDTANLDDGSMWPTSFALKSLGAAEEATIRKLVEKAVRPTGAG